MELAEQLAICGRLVGGAIAPLGGRWGLSGAQLSLMLVCRHGQAAGLAQTELADRLGVSPAHVSAQVESLRVRKLLESRRPSYDRRRQLWRLTAPGTALIDALLEELAPRLAAMDRQLGTDQIAELTRLLDLLQASFQPAGAAGRDAEPKLQSFSPAHPPDRQPPVPQSHRDAFRRAAS